MGRRRGERALHVSAFARPMTFFDVQRRHRHRTSVLIAVEILLVWLFGNVVVFPAHLANRCDADGGCEIIVRPDLLTAVTVAALIVLVLATTVLYASRRAVDHDLAVSTDEIAARADLAHLRPGVARLQAVVADMVIASGIAEPVLFVLDDAALNAYAVAGRGPRAPGALVCTSGLIAALDQRELTGVVAHEVAHLRNRDSTVIWTATFAVGAIVAVAAMAMMFADRGRHRLPAVDPETGDLMSARTLSELDQEARGRSGWRHLARAAAVALWLLARPAALLVRAAISRQREQLADAGAVEFTRDPGGLRSALQKIAVTTVRMGDVSFVTASLWIDAPTNDTDNGLGAWWARLLDTHPPIEQRIAWLLTLEGAGRTSIDGLDGVDWTDPHWSVTPR